MAGIWRNIGKGADDSPPSISEFLHLSNANIQRINFLTSNELSHGEEPLNPNQCRSLSSKLVRTLENIAGLFFFWDQGSTSAASTLSTRAFENFYLVSERAKELVESCCSEDWCQASAFQIQNEEAFKDILLETSLCYSAIYELLKDKVPYPDLRQTPTFEPPPIAEVMEDRLALLRRYQDFVDRDCSLDSLVQKQYLAKHLLRRLKCIISQSEDFGVTIASSSSRGDEWGEILELLGDNVCKTTWLGVPCAKKVFEDGVEEELMLKEARILALVNHPNIVKFISCGYDRDNTRLFIAMGHMETSLYSVIRKRSQARKGAPFPILSAVHIMLQIAYGTCYLHDAGVAHRDFKTSNIIVSPFSAPHLQDYFHVKLVDFGLSKVKLSASRSNTITRPRIGTTVYMPPEAFHHGKANWSKADVYSFGIMCSVILSGNEPFPNTKFQRSMVYEAICSGVRPTLPVKTPEDLACLIKECWDADRNVRPSFVDICTRLAQIRHRLLKGDADGHGFKNDLDGSASLYIRDSITKLSNARKQDCKQLLGKVIEEDEWFIVDEVERLQNTSIKRDEISVESRGSSSSKETTIMYDHGRPRLNEQQSPWTIPPLEGHYTWTNSWRLLRPGEGIVSFTVEGSTDVHVAISTSPKTRNPMYEVVIGGWRNSTSAIRRRAHGLNLIFVATVGVINPRSPTRLWVSIDKRTSIIQIGQGEPQDQDILIQYMDPYFILEAQFISFSTWNVPITYSNVVIGELEHIPGTSHDVEEKVHLDMVMDQKWLILPRLKHYTWAHYWKLPKVGQGVLAFSAEGDSDIHIAISAEPRTMQSMYEIVIGGWDNTQSVIRRENGGQNLCVVQTGITSNTSCFWVSLDNRSKLIRMGRGVPCQNTFCLWRDPDFLSESLYFSFTTFSTPITYSSVQVAALP